MNKTIWEALNRQSRVTAGTSYYGNKPQAIAYTRSHGRRRSWVAVMKFYGDEAVSRALRYVLAV